ncbi:MAG: cation diffusion facilitator family transporter [Alphaproteobacteria bacterium]
MIYKNHNLDDVEASQEKFAMLAVYWALSTVLILIVIKGIAYYYSGSAALLGSLTDTLGDGLISLMTFFSIRLSLAPADEDHRFGHGKIEGFSAMIQASFLCGAAVFLTFESAQRFMRPVEIDHHALGISVSLVAVILTLILVRVQSYALKRAPSLAIEADQRHYMNDVLINGAVIAGFAAHYMIGWIWLDAALGLVIAVYIGWTGIEVGRKAADMLMDREIGEAERTQIEAIVTANPQVHGMHDLRTRRTGMTIMISFDVELEPELTLRDAHAITRELEFALLEAFPHAEIIIHKDPKGDTYDARHKVQGIHH